MREEGDVVDPEPGLLDEAAPLRLRVVAHVRGIAQHLGLLDRVAHVQRVDDQDAIAADARHLSHRRADVGEVVRRGPARDDVERARRRTGATPPGR